MRWLVICLAAHLAAQAAVPESIVFCRAGRVWLQQAGSDMPRPVIADDPGWAYVHPTWLDAERLVVMRNRGGQWGRSNVGVVALNRGTVRPAEIQWLEKLAGAYAIGLAPDGGISYLKLARTGDEEVTVYLGSASSDGASAKSQPAYKAMYGVGDPVRHGLRASPDGLVSVPTFPTDVSSTTGALRWASRRFAELPFLNWDWLGARNLAEEWTSMAFGFDRWVALGSMRSGLWVFDRQSEQLCAIDTWDPGDRALGVPAISFGWTGEVIYYEVAEAWGDEPKTGEIRRVTPEGGTPQLVLRNASMPDVMPPYS